MIEPRPYQTSGLDLARAQFKAGKRRVLIVAPTGAGKTIIFSLIVLGHLAKGGRVLVVVHRRELIRQTLAKMIAAGVERVGVIAAGWPADPDAPVQVASIQTLLARDAALPPATLVVFDECHHFVAEQWGTVGAHYASAKIVGVTATPERGDGTPLGDLFDVLVPLVSVRELTDLGFLVPCSVIAPPTKTKKNSAHPVDAYEKHAKGRKAVVFAASVEAAYALAEQFTAKGYPAACVEGDTPADERDAILDRFARGELQILTNVLCLTEGWDCPSVSCAILARGCSATGTFLQMVGRVLRPSPETGKVDALVLDLRGVVHDHGLPDQGRTFSLEGRAISGGDAPVRTCPECEHVIPLCSRACPECGAALSTSDKGLDVAPMKLGRISKANLERAYWDEQIAIARARGYRLGWVAHRWQEKFGRFPAKFWREASRRAA